MNQSSILEELQESPSAHFINSQSCSYSYIKKDQMIGPYVQFHAQTAAQRQQSSSQSPSINGEGVRLGTVERPHLNSFDANINNNESVDNNNNVTHELSEGLSVSVVNISFQEIINLLYTNQSSSLSASIKKSIGMSALIVVDLLVYTLVGLILEISALYGTLSDQPTHNVRLMVAFFFLKWLSDALILHSLL